MDKFYVYMYLRAKNSKHGIAGSPYYIGKGAGYRAFSREHTVHLPTDRERVVFVARELSNEAACAEECRLIAHYGRIDLGTGCLSNRTIGGEGFRGGKHSEETRKKMSLSKKGVPKPPRSAAHRLNARLAQLGKVQSEESRRKKSEALKGRKRPPRSEEWKEKIRLGMLGKIPWNKGLKCVS